MSTRKSIFELENKIEDPTFEMNRLYSAFFHDARTIVHDGYERSFRKELERKIFPSWPYRDTFIDVHEYLDFLGVNNNCDETSFLHFLEFVYNIGIYAVRQLKYRIQDPILNATFSNVPRILAKMNCEFRHEGDKYIIVKKSADVDSIIQYAPDATADLLLSYGDFRIDKDVKTKQSILKKLDLYIEQNKTKLRGYDKGLYERIQQIVNKLGINHPIAPPYSALTSTELLAKYDE